METIGRDKRDRVEQRGTERDEREGPRETNEERMDEGENMEEYRIKKGLR